VKNVVFIPNIDLGKGRSESYQYSIDSWKHWCDKNDCELFILEDLLLPVEHMPIVWQRYYVFDLLEANNVKYNQVLLVDADTIIHPDCPNFFNETDGKYSAVLNNGCHEWVHRSISQWGPNFFDSNSFPLWRYINGGFQIFNESHKEYLTAIINWYNDNKDNLLQVLGKYNSGDQTCINFFREKYNLEMNILPECYNLQDMFKKNLLWVEGYSWWEDSLENMYKSGWIYHFNAIPQNPMNRDANYWMKRTYGELYAQIK
tara:strand:+ start:260 stop:1036 length:777 start_codon:yes stop_codon:yes gene_type:complete